MEAVVTATEASVTIVLKCIKQHALTAVNLAKYHSDQQVANLFSAVTVSRTKVHPIHAEMKVPTHEDPIVEALDQITVKTDRCLTLFAQTVAMIAKSPSDQVREEKFSVHDALKRMKVMTHTVQNEDHLTSQALTAMITEADQVKDQTTKHNLKH